MKITKSRLKQLIKEELKSVLDEAKWRPNPGRSGIPTSFSFEPESASPARSGQEMLDDDFPLEEDPDDGVPEAVTLMETLWDVVRGFYKLGRSDVALKLQKIAEIADEGHERLVPPGEGTPGFSLPEAPPTHSLQHQRLRKFRRP